MNLCFMLFGYFQQFCQNDGCCSFQRNIARSAPHLWPIKSTLSHSIALVDGLERPVILDRLLPLVVFSVWIWVDVVLSVVHLGHWIGSIGGRSSNHPSRIWTTSALPMNDHPHF